MKHLAIIKELSPKKQGYRIEVFEYDKPLSIKEFVYIKEAHDFLSGEGLTFQMGGSDGPLRGYWEIWQKG